MATFWNKLDTELQIIYANYLEIIEEGKENVPYIHWSLRENYRLSVTLICKERIEDIENLGFHTMHKILDNKYRGDVELEDLQKIASSDLVLSIRFGRKGRIQLDDSIDYIHAGGTGGVWRVNKSKGKFTGATGKGVVIGIIDSGIDYTHPVFYKTESPKKTTRIMRIWDMGLKPDNPDQSPKVSYMHGTRRYGVEYNDKQINDVLQEKASASSIKHKDCDGHGTHVASIAAGDGRAPKPKEKNSIYKYIGVAPEADIVVVKILDLFNDPIPGGTTLDYDVLFEDAVTYILKVTENELGKKPVVINYSIGDPHGPHDGLTRQEEFLRHLFGGSSARRVFVTSAGNDAGDRINGVVEFPGSGTGNVEIEFELYDKRSVKTSYKKCKTEDDTDPLAVDMWYKPPSSGAVTAAIKLKGATSFGTPLPSGSQPQKGNLGESNQFPYKLTHTSETDPRPAIPPNTQTDVIRHNIHLEFEPYNGDFEKSNFSIKLSGPSNHKIYVWCDIAFGVKGDRCGIKFKSANPANALKIFKPGEDKFQISIPSGASNILTVASFVGEKSDLFPLQGDISTFSSRGPLMDYSGYGTISDKPDISAPGDWVRAAKSKFTSPPGKSPCCQKSSPHDYTDEMGTSMSSPHIAGVAALMLEKNKNLTTKQLINIMRTNVAPGSEVLDKNEYGAGRVDAKEAYGAVP